MDAYDVPGRVPDVVVELIEGDDSAGLLRLVDGMCATREWDELVRVAAACRQAADRGRQLWPVAMHIEYRLALEGPATHAAAVLESGASRFTLGPLTEVAASTHSWADLAPHLPGRHLAAVVAQERVLRGEDLTGDSRAGGEIFELPLVLADHETGYPLPTYRADSSEFPDLALPVDRETVRLGGADIESATAPTDVAREHVWRDLVEAWTADSNASVRIGEAESGDALAAIGSLSTDVQIVGLEPGHALARMTWASAAGGASGRRRGGANGRFNAWWAAAGLSRVAWPPSGDFVAELAQVDWWWWEPVPRPSGHVFCLAVGDSAGGWASALEVIDLA